MASRGKAETEKLTSNLQQQIDRLMTQLQDLEDLRSELDENEYEETKRDTLAQLTEFKATLDKAIAGDVTLVDKFGSVQLAIQAAVSQAFKTPEVIRLFAKKEPGQLRQRLANLQVALKLQKISNDAYTEQAVEMLAALKKLGDRLTPDEESFLTQHKTASLAAFESVQSGLGQGTQERILSMAGSQVKSVKK